MLLLHCGWPGTSTSSTQAALFERRDRLAAAGVVYPDRWRSGTNPGHHGLEKLLTASPRSEGGLDDFKHFLAVHADRDVLLSDEGLTGWLLSNDRQEVLLRFLSAAREITPTRCVWTLRRFDEVFSSSYLVMLGFGFKLPLPVEYLDDVKHPNRHGIRNPDHLFEGMSKVEEAVGDVVHVKYDAGGAHSSELMRALRVSEPVGIEIQTALEAGRRLNARLTHKQAAALLNTDALSARAGVKLDKAALGKGFERGQLGFEGDRPCELLDRGTRVALHERALAAARRHGCRAYEDFFGEVEIEAPAVVSLGPDALTEGDLRRLGAFAAGEGQTVS